MNDPSSFALEIEIHSSSVFLVTITQNMQQALGTWETVVFISHIAWQKIVTNFKYDQKIIEPTVLCAVDEPANRTALLILIYSFIQIVSVICWFSNFHIYSKIQN